MTVTGALVDRLRADDGAAPVEFALITPLLLLVALAVLQLALVLHVREVAVGAASQGARVAAMTNGDLLQGKARAVRVLHQSIAAPALRSTHARIDREGPVPVAAVDMTLDLPIVGMFGPTTMTVTGRSLLESGSELVPGFAVE